MLNKNIRILIMVIIIKKYIIFFIIFFLILVRIFYINFYKKTYYKNKLDLINVKYVYSLSEERGRILDINGNVLVDNEKKRVIVYNKSSSISVNQELSIARKLSKYYSKYQEPNKKEICKYIFDRNSDLKIYLTHKDYNKYLKQVITYNEAKNIAYEYIKNNMINMIDEDDKKIIKIYSLMNKDYYYDKKIILDDIDDKTYFKILSENIPGITGEYIYKRVYPYGNLMRSIFGTIGKIDKENYKEYLKKGYELSDIVGKSYLEKEYDMLLKGKKAKYIVSKNGYLKLVEEGKKGKDLVLNIDINIEKKLSEILEKNIYNAKGKRNAEYYNGSYVVVGKPTGEVVAMLGYKIDEKGNLNEVSTDILNSSFTPGSIVKGASNTVGYHENVIDRGKKINDSCVKLYMNTEKCSYIRLGYVDDISAIEKSSNYYQFINAIKVMGYNYKYNMKVEATQNDFDKYRTIFKSYGLGSKTNIDLPNENTGIEGKKIAADLLLNYSIGQYDSYTPLQMLAYVNTLASKGNRYNLSLKVNPPVLNNTIDINEEDMNRILKGFENVVKKGTGSGYIYKNNGSGKTGTSETLVDTNNDNIYETKTISTSFIGFMPSEDPKYTFVIVSPNISSNKDKSNYKVPINRYIMADLTKFLFEN